MDEIGREPAPRRSLSITSHTPATSRWLGKRAVFPNWYAACDGGEHLWLSPDVYPIRITKRILLRILASIPTHITHKRAIVALGLANKPTWIEVPGYMLKKLFGQSEKTPYISEDDCFALIVDDDEDIRVTMRELFIEAGFQVSEASEGKAALAILRASAKPMVVFLDLMMPNGMSGEDTLNAIGADPDLIGKHGFILMTAAPNTLRLPFAQMLTKYDIPVLHKPFDIYEALRLAQDTIRRIVK